MNNIGRLEKKSGLLRILLFLEEKGEYMLSDIWKDSDISRNSGIDALDELKELKLLKSRIDSTKYPPRNLISLTERGHNVAQKLKEIEEILKG